MINTNPSLFFKFTILYAPVTFLGCMERMQKGLSDVKVLALSYAVKLCVVYAGVGAGVSVQVYSSIGCTICSEVSSIENAN